MRGLQVFVLAAMCIAVRATYIGYSNYGSYPRRIVYGYNGYDNQRYTYNAHPKYAYDYSVKDPHTGDFKTQWETRDGDVVRGAYSLAEPDGTTRIVEYTADKHNGFNAVVKRIGHAYHPQSYNSGYHSSH